MLHIQDIVVLVVHLIYSIILVKVAVEDEMTRHISNQLIQLFIPICIVSIVINPSLLLSQRVIGTICISIPMYGITKICRKGFGGGDIKFVAVNGFILGMYHIAWATYLALVVAAIVIVGSGKIRKNETYKSIAFGPYLCLGCFIAHIFCMNKL